MEVSGEQLADLSSAIRSAFPPSRLAELLRYRLDKSLNDIAFGEDYREVVFKVLTTADAEGWLSQFVVAARSSNPGNAELQAIAAEMLLSSSAPEEGNLERIVRATGKWSDVEAWRSKLGSLENRVCRIEVTGKAESSMGTGFLIGPQHVITNFHVVEMAIKARELAGQASGSASGIVVRFDYKRSADGATLDDGKVVGLAEDWLLDSSPPSPVDSQPDPKASEPSVDELDYAVLRLSKSTGTSPIGRSPEPDAPQRGWIGLPTADPVAGANAPLFMLQHPEAKPLQLAIGTAQELNANRTRVRYAVNSLPGSSGAPVFDDGWELIALHHAGDPNFQAGHDAAYNEGIPVKAIRDRLERGGMLAQLESDL